MIAPILVAYAGVGLMNLHGLDALGQFLQMVLNGGFVEIKMIKRFRQLLGFENDIIGAVDRANEGPVPCDLLTICY